jgi:hypothetical protein
MNVKTETPASAKAPKTEVLAYIPQGEPFPVLFVMVGAFQSHVCRRGETGYLDLVAMCNGQPKWIYSQTPRALV